jgi:hypothetical protein
MKSLRSTYYWQVAESAGAVEPLELPSQEIGMLDVVFCIDISGSMMDDIGAVQLAAPDTLANLEEYARTNNISLHTGLLTYTRHDEPSWLNPTPLTADDNVILAGIQAINITNAASGRGGNEDMYGAMLFAMNKKVAGRQVDMRWRAGAAKIAIPIGDEPPDDPDWEGNDLADVARVAKALDPVHMYPLVPPKQGVAIIDSAVNAMTRIADATGGKVIKVNSAKELPEAMVSTVKLAVRRHKEEVWRKTNPPYLLFNVSMVVGILVLAGVLAAGISQRRQRRLQSLTAGRKPKIDPMLTGEWPDVLPKNRTDNNDTIR